MAQYEYESLTDLGRRFGVSCQKVGQWLEMLDLRVVGESPTALAFGLGLVKAAPTNRGSTSGYFYTWHTEKTIKLLEEAGHQRIDKATASKAHPLIGPFTLRLNGTDAYEILNQEGNVVLWTIGEENARFVVKLLNLAFKGNKIPPQK
jgi:hypothetical protein